MTRRSSNTNMPPTGAGCGDASAANQTTQNAILSKIAADYATLEGINFTVGTTAKSLANIIADSSLTAPTSVKMVHIHIETNSVRFTVKPNGSPTSSTGELLETDMIIQITNATDISNFKIIANASFTVCAIYVRWLG
jgi:hypothetical protein